MSLANIDPNFSSINYTDNPKVAPNEIDQLEQYQVLFPSISATFIGTAASGTSTQSKALVLLTTRPDYPRNLLYGVIGTNDMGGTWTVTGTNQFGDAISESVGSGTVAAGTPAFAIAGTSIFAQITGGTFTVATGAVGGGLGQVGVAVGTGATSKSWFGLPSKIGSVSDIKSIAWAKELVSTAMSGGTYTSGVHVNLDTHAFGGTFTTAGTETYSVLFRSTHDNAGSANVHTW